jgi:hypothetical protein
MTLSNAGLRRSLTSSQKAAEETAAVTDGKVDYLIANAGYVTTFDSFDPIGVL